MEQNMNMSDTAIRYAVAIVIGIIGGALHSLPIMMLAIPFFLAGILGICPINAILGRNTACKRRDAN